MKLLFDQNLPPRLVARLAGLFPDSAHVYALGLDQSLDMEVWLYARDNDFIIVSKDADFSELSLLHGHPPKLVWLRVGNCTTREIEELLRANYAAIEQMNQDATVGILSLF
jgi:predicted nuclease of predicted toxin-antitoxin system